MAKLVIKTEGLPAEVIELRRGVNRLGRSSLNDFQVDHESVSRFHAEVELQEHAMFVRDMDSSNGTFVNDEQIIQCPLESGQLLRLGDVIMEVREAPEAAAADAFVPCANHPTQAASLHCPKCLKRFCGGCVHILRLSNGRIHRLCPICSGHCEPLAGMNQANANKLTTLVRKLLKKPPPPRAYFE